MKIVIVCDVLGSENNGTTIAAMNLIRYLQSAGHEVRVLCADQNKKGEKNVFVAPNRSFGRLLDAYVRKIGVTLSKKDKKLVEKALDGADHVHSILPFALGKQAAKYAKKHNIPITAGFHMQAENLTSYLKVDRIKFLDGIVYRHIYNKFYRYVDGIHYPTDFIRGIFESHIKKHTNGYVISNGVNAEVCKRPTPKPQKYLGKTVVLTTGRYATEKAQDVLIKAVAYCRHAKDIVLILAGQGVKEKKYKKLAQKLQVDAVFEFFSRKEIIDVINYSDIYVHPAINELEGIACLEAIMCGKLTIVSDSPLSATREFAEDQKCVFKAGDYKDLARILDFWIDNPQLKAEYEDRYLRHAKVFRLEDCMRKMEEMIEDFHPRRDMKP